MSKSLNDYYHDRFRSDVGLLLSGFPPAEARVFYLGTTWMNGCSLLPRIAADSRARFLVCLHFTVLADQAMHSHFLFEHSRFEELTQYPKFRVGLGHPAYLNPSLIFEIPIRLHLVSEEELRRTIPDGMRLFVEETVSFFGAHMPQIVAAMFFERLFADPDFGGRMREASVDRNADTTREPTIQQLIVKELSQAVAAHQEINHARGA